MQYYTLFALLAFLGLYGCSSDKASIVEVVPASSSNEVLMRFFDAVETEDTDSLLSLVDGGPDAQDFFASVMEHFIQSNSFEKKFISAYGENSWEEFQEPIGWEQSRPDFSIIKIDLAGTRKVAQEWVANDSNKGIFDRLIEIKLPVKEKNDGWVIDGSSIFPDEETMLRCTKNQRTLAEFIHTYSKAIGHPGISGEDIDYQMGKDLMIALLGGEIIVNGKSPNPDRFKINDI